jgi:hypothetical protein
MNFDLRRDDTRAQAPRPRRILDHFNDGGSGLIARRFNAQHFHS